MEVEPKYIEFLTDLAWKLGRCFLVIVIGIIISSILRKIIKRSFEKAAEKYPKKNYETTSYIALSITKYLVYFFIVLDILWIFNVPVQSILAVAGIGGLAIGFAAKGIAEDCISGITILMENQFAIGDSISIDDKSGTVESIDIRTTRLRGYDGDVHIIPNSLIKSITNMSKEYNRAVVDVPVSYCENIEHVLDILKNEMEHAKDILVGLTSVPEVQGITQMSDTCLVVRIIADCQIGENWGAERDLRKIIKIRFDKEGIAPPYPHQVTHLEKNETNL